MSEANTSRYKDSALQKLTSTQWLREFQRKLHERAKAEPKFRFYRLYDKTYRIEVLEEAYRKAKSNGGTSGQDTGLRFQQFIVEDGLLQGLVKTIIQDHKGFRWLGTNDGLNLYESMQLP